MILLGILAVVVYLVLGVAAIRWLFPGAWS